MRHVLLTLLVSFPLLLGARSVHHGRSAEKPDLAIPGEGVLLWSDSSLQTLARRETTGPDTFALYGGPDQPTEGKFQLADMVSPDWGDGSGDLVPGNYGGGPGAWESHDLTEIPTYWHRSTFNGETIGAPGNHVFWCGTGNGDPNEVPAIGWAAAPGYGNGWNDAAVFEIEMLDPSVGQTVSLDFDFSSDTEPGYDYFIVEFDSAGTWTEVLRRESTHTSTSFAAESPRPIHYEPNAYGTRWTSGENHLAIRLRVTSDGAWSDQDGLRPTDGAVQIDNVSLSYTDGVTVHNLSEDFETEKQDWEYLFSPEKNRFAGDFGGVYARLTDLDPCRDNGSPAAGFIDYGQVVRNWRNHPDYLANGDSTTGGSPGATYGIPGGFVNNFTGGLSINETRLVNEIWSPWIAWDLPTPDDDDVAVTGAYLRFSNWVHLPLINGYFWVWHVRGQVGTPGVDAPGPWRDRFFVYYGGGVPIWGNYRFELADLLQNDVDHVQIGLGTLDYADVFGFPGTTATPSPVFDNVALYKYRMQGPVLSARTIDLAQDRFPVSGSIDASTQASRDALDVPFDMANDVNSGDLVIAPGDSIVFGADSLIPGTTIADLRIVWALKTNPLFEDAIRQVPARPVDENVVGGPAGTVWTGETLADSVVVQQYYGTRSGISASLPDEDFLYPGDVLHYYLRAEDSDGRVTTMPMDTSAFLDFDADTTYDRTYTVRALPSLQNAEGDQPPILVINDFGRRGGEPSWTSSLHALGLQEGIDFDTYTVQGPTSNVSNGIGTATAGQLDGYAYILYFAGNLSTGILSNGDANRSGNDKANDLAILNDWLTDVSSPRNIALFGDYIASGNDASSEGANFVGGVMGVSVLGVDVRPVIGGQTAPMVVPNPGAVIPAPGTFLTEYVAYGGCLAVNQFDQIQPLTGAEAGHWFLDPSGVPVTSAAAGVASVINDHGNGLVMTFPYSSMFVIDAMNRAAGPSARVMLFGEILSLFGAPQGAPPITAAPEARRSELSLLPNPFNPSTRVSFSHTIGKTGSVKVFNLRGELVRTLHQGEFTQVDGFTKIWDGTDDRGASVASGVYVIQARAGGEVATKKAALVK